MKTYLNLNNLRKVRRCRLCLGIISQGPIYNIACQRITAIIHFVVGIEANVDDGLPRNVCKQCYSILKDYEKFKLNCIASEEWLMKSCEKDKSQDMLGPTNNKLELYIEPSSNLDATSLSIPSTGNILESEASNKNCDTDRNENIETTCTSGSDMQNVRKICSDWSCHEDLGPVPTVGNEESVVRPSSDAALLPAVHKITGIFMESSRNLEVYSGDSPQNRAINILPTCLDEEESFCKVDNKIEISENEISETNEEAGFIIENHPYISYPENSNILIPRLKDVCNRERHSQQETKSASSMRGASVAKIPSFNRHAEEEKNSKYPCSTCGAIFSTNRLLDTHNRQHQEGANRCSTCGKVFSTRASLKRHSVLHTGVKPFSCPLCGKTFNQSAILRRHTFIHDGVQKPYNCAYCKRGFTQKPNLRWHIFRNHLNLQMTFNCETCNKKFRHFSGLSRHKNEHKAPPTVFICSPCCGLIFTDATLYKKHVLSFHKNAGSS